MNDLIKASERILTCDLQDANVTTAERIQQYRNCLRQCEQDIQDAYNRNVSPGSIVKSRADTVDLLLQHAWQHFLGDSHADDVPALVAVGGYGRRELHPGSDIDLMILLPGDDDSPWQTSLTDFLTFLWDIGLEVGHSVRSINECIEQATADITVATNLMEARLLHGAETLFEEMREKVGPDHVWPSVEFFSAKWKEQIARHNKYDDTAYKLEPNIKETPGGLRDIQMIGWVAKRHFGAETLKDLIKVNFLNEDEYALLIKHQEFLWKVRIALHLLTGRSEDRLLFDFQRDLAEQLGFSDDKQQLGVEKFMKQYYRTVGALSRLNEMLLQLFQEEILYKHESEEPVVINERFQSRKGFIEVVNEQVFAEQPSALLEIFLLLEQDPGLKGVRAETIRLIRKYRHLINEDFRSDQQCRELFMDIIRQPQGLTHEFRRMHRYGILGAYIPLFEKVTGLMQYDLFHVYTVDEHTLFVVRNLRRFTVDEFSNELPHCSKVIHEVTKPEVLYLAGLFHDIAKGRGGDHSELGADDAFRFCREHYMNPYDSGIVSWLVRNHLVMSRTSQREDISDPDVINNFAEIVGNKERLDMIYLLTVADMRATSPDVWNSWKGTLLRDLYDSTLKAFRKRLGSINNEELVRDIQEKASQLLTEKNIDAAAVKKLWQTLSEDYFLRYSPDEIISHAEAIIPLQDKDLPLVLVRDALTRGGTEVFIYTPVRIAIFAAITSVLDQLGLNIADARIIRSSQGYSFDSYIILDQSGNEITSQQSRQEIQHYLHEKLSEHEIDVSDVSRIPPRQLRHFHMQTDVKFDTDSRTNSTIMEVITADRAGLLASIGKILHEQRYQVHNARISTFGARAEDIFYITDEEGNVLDAMAKEVLRNIVINELDSPVRE